MDKRANATIAKLESKVDFLEAELIYLNKILVQVGFTEGILTLKETVNELLEESQEVIFKKEN